MDAPRARTYTLVRSAAIVWSIVAVVAHSDTGVAFPLWMLLFGTLLLIAIGGMLALAFDLLTARPPGPSRRDVLRAWIRVPMPVLLTFVLLWLAVPLKARLFFSGPALRQSGAFLAGQPPARLQEKPAWIGLFRVREFVQFGDELRFLTSSCGLVDTCGLVYSPGGRPPNRGEDTFEHLYGEWWHWHQSW